MEYPNPMEEELTAKMVEDLKDDLYAKDHLCVECKYKHEDIFLVGNNCENLCVNCMVRVLVLVQKGHIWVDLFTNFFRNRHPQGLGKNIFSKN